MTETKREYWSKLIAEQEASGERIRPFCRERGIGEHSFHHWGRRLREPQAVQFALVETKGASPEMTAAMELVLNTGERLRIGAVADAALLRLVLEAVRG